MLAITEVSKPTMPSFQEILLNNAWSAAKARSKGEIDPNESQSYAVVFKPGNGRIEIAPSPDMSSEDLAAKTPGNNVISGEKIGIVNVLFDGSKPIQNLPDGIGIFVLESKVRANRSLNNLEKILGEEAHVRDVLCSKEDGEVVYQAPYEAEGIEMIGGRPLNSVTILDFG